MGNVREEGIYEIFILLMGKIYIIYWIENKGRGVGLNKIKFWRENSVKCC